MQTVKIKMPLPGIQFLFLLIFSFFASGLIAQKNCVITGKILDKATGETMIGATVHVDSTDIGVITDIEGIYSLSLPPGSYTLNILYVGMAPGKISVEGKEGEVVYVDFAMDLAKESALEEVVVKATADRSSD